MVSFHELACAYHSSTQYAYHTPKWSKNGLKKIRICLKPFLRSGGSSTGALVAVWLCGYVTMSLVKIGFVIRPCNTLHIRLPPHTTVHVYTDNATKFKASAVQLVEAKCMHTKHNWKNFIFWPKLNSSTTGFPVLLVGLETNREGRGGG